jgi:hypothetical protein
MKVIFCQDPLNQKQVDTMYQAEAEAVKRLGLQYDLLNFEDLVAGSLQTALRRVPSKDTLESAIYRGWMLKPFQYEYLYNALLERNIQLINTPAMYRHCHYLPQSYEVIADYTPKSMWLPYDDRFMMDSVYDLLKVFADKPIMVKDYVKSQKHYWHEACYIPDASNREAVELVVRRFLELQGNDLNEGLVFREFIQFQPLTQHSRSDMPLTEEYRIFVMDGQPVFHTKYWSEGDYSNEVPELKPFEPVLQNVKSWFFTMDIARRIDGHWMIVELGDGQVAGLADHVDAEAFYKALMEIWKPQ